ncbi:MAG: DUF1330 domain-containing protein [Gammaproteobacteria bacterium]|nr:DUF1330 domain-containing protein [Gammaproteobacteria bacterium]
MAKGYVVAHIKVHDPEGFKTFAAMAGPVIKEFGGTVLARDPKPELREGELEGVCVIVEFDSPEQAKAFYESAGYTAAKEFREKISDARLVLVSGL